MSLKLKIHNFIKCPQKILIKMDNINLIHLSDRKKIEYEYKSTIGKHLNLEEPKTFNEKLQYLKLYNRKAEYTKMVDKYLVKEYAASIIGKKYIIPTIGVYDNFDDINFEKLPEKFVIKCTHDSGGIYICKDKDCFDYTTAKKRIDHFLKRDFYNIHREWPYKNVKPRVLVEKYMEDSSGELKDYKFLCFNGKVKCSFVCTDRFNREGLKVTFFDKNWKKMPFERHYPIDERYIEKPKNYELMIEFAERFAKEIPFVRVDFYEINNQLYFGEITFFPGSGYEEFTPEEWDYTLGSWIDLSKVNRDEK